MVKETLNKMISQHIEWEKILPNNKCHKNSKVIYYVKEEIYTELELRIFLTVYFTLEYRGLTMY